MAMGEGKGIQTIGRGRMGQYRGRICLFTHRDPSTGKWYTDDSKVTAWVDPKNIIWL